jgi:hypothetical protein
MPTVDPLEPVAFGPAMGEGGQDQKPRHETQSARCEDVLGFEGQKVLCGSQVDHQRQHLTTER